MKKNIGGFIALACVVAIGVTACAGELPPPEPTLTESCEGKVLEDSVSKTAWVYGGKGGYTSIDVTVRLCVDKDGNVSDLEVE